MVLRKLISLNYRYSGSAGIVLFAACRRNGRPAPHDNVQSYRQAPEGVYSLAPGTGGWCGVGPQGRGLCRGFGWHVNRLCNGCPMQWTARPAREGATALRRRQTITQLSLIAFVWRRATFLRRPHPPEHRKEQQVIDDLQAPRDDERPAE